MKSTDAVYNSTNRCRICDSDSVTDLICFGNQPLANSLKDSREAEEIKSPLTLSFCKKSNHVQLKETVNKELLFSNYIWVTGTAVSTKRFSKEFAQRVVEITGIKKNELILEVASNDGTFLRSFKELGYSNVLGVDPAANLKEAAEANGIKTITAFWDKETSQATQKKYGKAKVVMARNVLPHVSQIFEVVDGIKSILSEDGVAVIEFHYSGTILNELHYDSVYHEHLHFFSLQSITSLFEKYALFPFHADPSPISGGGYILYLTSEKKDKSRELLQYLKKEETEKVNLLSSWEKFAVRCKEHKQLSQDIIAGYKGKRVLGFGSSARSSTYLNFCEFSNEHIEAIIDNNSLKQGKFSPGSSIPIISLEEGLKRNPDIIFLLAWNFKDEIMNSCRSKGYKGEFIIPFPKEPRIVS